MARPHRYDCFEKRARAFAPADYRRLVTVKWNYDPDNLFQFNQHIPLVIDAS